MEIMTDDWNECKIKGCTREPFDDSGYCADCLGYMDGTYGLPP